MNRNFMGRIGISKNYNNYWYYQYEYISYFKLHFFYTLQTFVQFSQIKY